MSAATMLPLKAEPVVTGTKDSNIEGIDDAVVEEPVSDSWVLLDSFVPNRFCQLEVCCDGAGKFCQLEVCCAVGE